jgi:outer membrane immunogenic protein
VRFSTILAAAATAALLAAPSAQAADLSGARVELVGGWDDADFDFNSLGQEPESDGAVYGIGAGYDFAVGREVALGVDVEATDSTAGFTFVTGADSSSYALGRDLYAGGRLTVAASSRLNFVFKVGYSSAHVRRKLVTPVFAEDVSYTTEAVRIAGGAQFAIGEKAYVGAEYRWADYDTDLERGQAIATVGLRF